MKYLLTALGISFIFSSQAQQTNCKCTDLEGHLSETSQLLTYSLNGKKVFVCGYDNSKEIKPGLFFKNKKEKSSKTLYVSGFGIYNCLDKNPIFVQEGEVNMDMIKTYPGYIEVTTLNATPIGKNFEFKHLPVISYKIKFEENVFKSDTSFVFPTKIFTKEFLASLKKKVDQMKKSNKKEDIDNYKEYLISYLFINAVLNPSKYSEKFKNMEDLDGYYAEIHDTLLNYYSIFEKQNHK